MNRCDFLEKQPVLSLDLSVPVLRILLNFLLVDDHLGCWLTLNDGLHVGEFLPVYVQVHLSPFPGEDLRRPVSAFINECSAIAAHSG